MGGKSEGTWKLKEARGEGKGPKDEKVPFRAVRNPHSKDAPH